MLLKNISTKNWVEELFGFMWSDWNKVESFQEMSFQLDWADIEGEFFITYFIKAACKFHVHAEIWLFKFRMELFWTFV